MKNRQKVFIVLAAIIIGTLLTWYLQVYRDRIQEDEKPKFAVTIPPVKFLIEQIAGDDFAVTTLLPEGVSPETYEPTPKQIISVSEAEIIFTTGLIDFEKVLVEKVSDNSDAVISLLSKDIRLKNGACDHLLHDNTIHNHGVDPHIWTSLRCLKIMTDNIYSEIRTIYPDSSKYFDNYLNLIQKLDSADIQVGMAITQSDIKYFLIYHPALSYYADDYSIEQVALEKDGKEPTADWMKLIIDRAKHDSVKTMLYQKYLSPSVVMTAAKEIGAEAVAFDPLAEDVIENLLWITKEITRR